MYMDAYVHSRKVISSTLKDCVTNTHPVSLGRELKRDKAPTFQKHTVPLKQAENRLGLGSPSRAQGEQERKKNQDLGNEQS